MRSSLVVRASDCQCTSCNGPGFDPIIRRHSGIRVAADEAVSIIYSSRILCLSSCLSSCRPVIFLSYSCRPVIVAERWAILYVLVIKLTKETRQRVFRGRDYRWGDRKGTDRRGRVLKDLSLLKPNLRNMSVHSATCSCSIELYELWYTLEDFLPNWNFRGVFSKYY